MSASGLTEATCDLKNFRHVTAMADYALRLREQLAYVNEHSFNNFKIRVGEFRRRYSRVYFLLWPACLLCVALTRLVQLHKPSCTLQDHLYSFLPSGFLVNIFHPTLNVARRSW